MPLSRQRCPTLFSDDTPRAALRAIIEHACYISGCKCVDAYSNEISD